MSSSLQIYSTFSGSCNRDVCPCGHCSGFRLLLNPPIRPDGSLPVFLKCPYETSCARCGKTPKQAHNLKAHLRACLRGIYEVKMLHTGKGRAPLSMGRAIARQDLTSSLSPGQASDAQAQSPKARCERGLRVTPQMKEERSTSVDGMFFSDHESREE